MNKYKLVRFDFDDIPEEYHSMYPFKKDDAYVLLGEIEQMPGHCVVSHMKTGQIYSGYHTDNFIELTEEET